MSADVPRSHPPRPRVQLNIAIDPALKARITLCAVRRGCFESTLVREAIESYVAVLEKKGGRS